MVGEEPGAGEGLVTMSAFVVPVVGLHVHGQGWHARVELVADIAVSSLVSVDLSVWICLCGSVCGFLCVPFVCVDLSVWICLCGSVCVDPFVWTCLCGSVCVDLSVMTCL